MILIQKGRNSAYPEKIETWRYGEKTPEWLSDICKVRAMEGSGNLILDIRKTTSGGYELLNSTGDGSSIVTATRMDDYICHGVNGGKVFSLTESQINLLYKEEK